MTQAVNLAQYANNSPSWRNRIINGAMVIDQRNAGASVTPTDGQYTIDRWMSRLSQASKYTVQQNAGSVTPPAGFNNYIGVTSSSSYSVTSTDYFSQQYRIEGFNLADLGWGAAGAQTITISFWVRSSLTGTFGGSIANGAANRCYVFSYTINSANTWEQKSITIAGDTSGTWLKTNGIGMFLSFGYGQGSTTSASAGSWLSSFYSNVTGATSVVGTNGATFYITGVQLEKGTAATNFEYRDYGRELMMCQRYFTVLGGANYSPIGVGASSTTTASYVNVPFPVAMRAAPTLGSFSTLIITDRQTYDLTVTGFGALWAAVQGAHLGVTHAGNAAVNRPAMLTVANTGAGFLQFNAEL